jgi:hypothetical protein
MFPSSSKAAPSHINNIQFEVLIRSSVQNKPSSWPMRSTSAVSCVISQLEDIFRMHHPTRNSYSIPHNEKCEKPRTEFFRRSHNVFPSPIIPCLDKIKKIFSNYQPIQGFIYRNLYKSLAHMSITIKHQIKLIMQ